ncbi:Uncharacterised protein [Haemophilus influenzae]|uniref:Uncharacterized protein n=1 Tax=Haemophilus influenzae TaxID=727 RepID=A0A2X1Q1H2_HAEIF|nr:Uncharacterised protein [Haemophilus influenzae]
MQASHSVHFKILNGGEVSFVLGTLVVFLYKSKNVPFYRCFNVFVKSWRYFCVKFIQHNGIRC